MKPRLLIVTTIGVLLTSILHSQTININKRRTTPTSSLGKTATFDYIQGKLLSLTPEDGTNDLEAATFDEPTCTVRIEHKAKDFRDSFKFGDLDINNTRWSIFDPNPDGQSGLALIVELSLYTNKGLSHVEESSRGISQKKQSVNLLFSLPKAAEIPSFQNKMSKAVKHLISLCSGQSEIKPF